MMLDGGLKAQMSGRLLCVPATAVVRCYLVLTARDRVYVLALGLGLSTMCILHR